MASDCTLRTYMIKIEHAFLVQSFILYIYYLITIIIEKNEIENVLMLFLWMFLVYYVYRKTSFNKDGYLL